MREKSDLVGIRKVQTEMEGLLLTEVLNGAGIECQLFSFHDTVFDGISQNWAEGSWGEIRVFEEDKERAAELLDEYEKSQPDSGE